MKNKNSPGEINFFMEERMEGSLNNGSGTPRQSARLPVNET